MKQGRIIYIEQKNNGRRWAAVASFAVAAAAGLYAAWGTDNSTPELKPESVRSTSPQQVWGHVAEMDANGQQKPTNDMWGLLLRAQNEASQAEIKADQAYAAKMDEYACRAFYRSRMDYNAFLDESDPVKKFEYLHLMGVEHRTYFTGLNQTFDRKGGPPPPFWTDVWEPTARQAVPVIERRIKNNPQDHIGNVRLYSLLNLANPAFNHHDISDKLEPERARQAFQMLQNLEWPAPDTAEGEHYKRASWEIYVLGNGNNNEKIFPYLGITAVQLKPLLERVKAYRDHFYDVEDERKQKRERNFREDHGAPCP